MNRILSRRRDLRIFAASADHLMLLRHEYRKVWKCSFVLIPIDTQRVKGANLISQLVDFRARLFPSCSAEISFVLQAGEPEVEHFCYYRTDKAAPK